MFTGLIATTATLVALEKKNRPVLTVRVALDKPVAVGDSVAVDGICLTVIERKKDLLRFNLAAPTLKLSNLQDQPAGSPLNIELPLTLNDYLGGHLVSGHIDGTARLRSINKSDRQFALQLHLQGARVAQVHHRARLGGPERRQPHRGRSQRFLVCRGDHPANPGHHQSPPSARRRARQHRAGSDREISI